jgi:hypothetical protein
MSPATALLAALAVVAIRVAVERSEYFRECIKDLPPPPIGR